MNEPEDGITLPAMSFSDIFSLSNEPTEENEAFTQKILEMQGAGEDADSIMSFLLVHQETNNDNGEL